jgi:hypothetical protein
MSTQATTLVSIQGERWDALCVRAYGSVTQQAINAPQWQRKPLLRWSWPHGSVRPHQVCRLADLGQS